ncbi:MAG: PDZ domain-containing protein [Magnetococcales bacterium]|nr:PDZ domain-containing protein [Magnetococcales bacterium]
MIRLHPHFFRIGALCALFVAAPASAGGWLGITVQAPEGVQVGEILKDGPADKAGMAKNDILTKADGKPIGSIQQFLGVLASATPGKEMLLTIVRKGEEKEIKITPDDSRDHPARLPEGRQMENPELLQERVWNRSENWSGNPMPPSMDPARNPMTGHPQPPLQEPAPLPERVPQTPAEPQEPPPTVWLGVAPDLSPHGHGVVLTRVAPGGPGEKAGMKTGDLIISLNGQSVSSPRAMSRILRSFRPGDLVEVTLNRNGQMIDSQAQLAAPPAEKP